AFNGYEFALFFDQSYIQVSSYDLKAGIFNNPFAASQFNGNGSLRLAVVNLGPLITVSNGPLLNITFKVVKTGGVSPLVLAAPTAIPSPYAAAPPSICNACPAGSPDWTRLVAAGTALDVQTQDGYFKNVGGKTGPVANFITSPLNPTQGSIVNFNASSSYDPDNFQASNNGILRYMWDFGDTSNQANLTSFTPFVSHVFNAIGYPNSGFTGNFSVRLTVIDMDNGVQEMITERVEIASSNVHDIGITRLSLMPNPVAPGQNETVSVDVTDLGTSSETYNLTMILGPQNVSFARLNGLMISPGRVNTFVSSLTTSSLTAGFYQIRAVASDPLDTNLSNNVAFATLQLVVPDEPPTANFTIRPNVSVAGQHVFFNATGSMDPDGMVNVWAWNFGDGSFQQFFGSPFADHVYNIPGNFTVTLTVTDSAGLMASKTMIVQVVPRPQHDVGISFVQPFPPVAVSGQQITLEAGIVNTGSDSSTIDLTFYYNGKVAVTQRGIV